MAQDIAIFAGPWLSLIGITDHIFLPRNFRRNKAPL
jgi:hypothetical protein